jgi:hypothetical protein
MVLAVVRACAILFQHREPFEMTDIMPH